MMYKTSGSFGNSRRKAISASKAVRSSLRLMAQRAMAIRELYRTCFPTWLKSNFLRIVSASSHCPLVTRSAACSADLVTDVPRGVEET